MKVSTNTWIRWIGLRYLKSKKTSNFLSFITVLSVGGVGIGVTAMIVVLSVMDGFETQLRKRLMSTRLHVLVEPTSKVDGYDMGVVGFGSIREDKILEKIAQLPGVESVYPVLTKEAILKTGRKVSGIMLKGVGRPRLKMLEKQLVEVADEKMLYFNTGTDSIKGSDANSAAGSDSNSGSAALPARAGKLIRLPGIFVGQELAYMLGLVPGDRVTLVSPTETQGPFSSIPRMKRFVVEGVYESGLPDQEVFEAFTTTKAAQSFIRKRDVINRIEITVNDFDDAPSIARSVSGLLPNYRVKDWIQLNSTLFASLRLERIAMFVILAFIVVVASFNIVTTLTLMVLEKKKDIAILRTMGAQKSEVAGVFFSQGLLIGLLGVGFGLIAAFGISLFLANTNLIQLPDIYYDTNLPVTFRTMYYGGVGVCAFSIVVLACLYPSRRAAHLHPIEGIRIG